MGDPPLQPDMEQLTPKQIVAELDKYIIGQDAAKRTVAVAIRNRWRRQQLPPEIASEISPTNIIMVGPTGVGKTEIARRISALTGAPFIKIEATKFTEVGYHGRDVDSIVRDLVEQAISMVRAEHAQGVQAAAESAVEEQLLDLLLPNSGEDFDAESAERREHARDQLRERLAAGDLEDREVEISTTSKAISTTVFSNMGIDQVDPDMSRLLENLIPEQTSYQRLAIGDARRVLIGQQTERMIDREELGAEAVRRTEQAGIVFLDEIDKIASGNSGSMGQADVSREGVQRDLLPIVEGSTVTTRYGPVNTDHVLFIAAGAFSSASVSDLMPELQGRFPLRVRLEALSGADFVRILTEPDNALTKQQQALLSTEGITIEFEPDGIRAMASLAARLNREHENIGARRLMTIMEKIFEPINFNAQDMVASGKSHLRITEKMVAVLAEATGDEELGRFVL